MIVCLTPLHMPDHPGHCVDLPYTGLCKESIPRWYYNPFSETCERFTYGGCHGNQNNFEEEHQCLESCRGISSKQGGSRALGRALILGLVTSQSSLMSPFLLSFCRKGRVWLAPGKPHPRCG